MLSALWCIWPSKMVRSVTVNTIWTRFYGSTGRRIPQWVHVGWGCARLKPCKHGSRSQSCLFTRTHLHSYDLGSCLGSGVLPIISPSTEDDQGRWFPSAVLPAAALTLTGCVRMSATCTPQYFSAATHTIVTHRLCVITVSLATSPPASGSIIFFQGLGAPPSQRRVSSAAGFMEPVISFECQQTVKIDFTPHD